MDGFRGRGVQRPNEGRGAAGEQVVPEKIGVPAFLSGIVPVAPIRYPDKIGSERTPLPRNRHETRRSQWTDENSSSVAA